jgi:predicted transcriptional regulator
MYSQEGIRQFVESLYMENEYVRKHPSLHIEDSPWKISKILPLIDELFTHHIDKACEDVNKTQIVYGANLNFNMANRYLSFLINRGLLERVEDDTYRITERGRDALKNYNHALSILDR